MGRERNDTTVANMYNYITVPTTNVRCYTSMMHCILNNHPFPSSTLPSSSVCVFLSNPHHREHVRVFVCGADGNMRSTANYYCVNVYANRQ